MPLFTIVQPIIHTDPIGHPAAWDPILNRSGGRCECGGTCGRTHGTTGGRCDRQHDHGRVRLVVAPADLTLSATAAVRLPVAQLRAWCPDCYRMARRRQLDAETERARLESQPGDALFDL